MWCTITIKPGINLFSSLNSYLFSHPAGRGHVDFLETVEGSDGVLLLLEADQDEVRNFASLDDGVSVGVVWIGAELTELIKNSEIPGPKTKIR